MNRRSYGYLVRALNEFASLTARCGLKDVHRPVAAKVPIRIDGYRGNPVYGEPLAILEWLAGTKVDGVDQLLSDPRMSSTES